jgi:hypothetical protein
MLMTFSNDEHSVGLIDGLGSLAHSATGFQGPSGRCVASEKCRCERGRKPRQAVIKVI